MARLTHLAALGRRFLTSLSAEGPGPALRKTRIYLGAVWNARAPRILGGRRWAPPPPDHMLVPIWSEMAKGQGFHAPRRMRRGPSIALIGDLNLPQCKKYRIEQLAQFWQAQGIACDYSHYEDVQRATRLMQQATHLCEYRLQSLPLTAMYRYEARRLGLPVLYDIDDPLFSVPAYATYANMSVIDPGLQAHFMSEAPKYAAMMTSADLLTFSTPALAEHARQFTDRPTYLRRNYADADTLSDGAAAQRRAQERAETRRTSGQDDLFRLVFASGSQGHEADFALIRDVVTDFVTADPGRRLTILGHFDKDHLPEALAGQTEHIAFAPYEDYLTHLAEADLALMPLCDDLFNRCKSAVRVIDAASVGLPAVVSPVGDQVALIDEGQTGFVAHTPADWMRAFEALAADPARARRMGRTARAGLERHWAGDPGPHLISPQVLEWIRQ